MPQWSWDLDLAAPNQSALPTLTHPIKAGVLAVELVVQEAEHRNTIQPPDPLQPPPQSLPLSGPLQPHPHPHPLQTSQTHSHRSQLPFLRTSVINKARP